MAWRWVRNKMDRKAKTKGGGKSEMAMILKYRRRRQERQKKRDCEETKRARTWTDKDKDKTNTEWSGHTTNDEADGCGSRRWRTKEAEEVKEAEDSKADCDDASERKSGRNRDWLSFFMLTGSVRRFGGVGGGGASDRVVVRVG